MVERDFDKIFRDRLEEHEIHADDSVWAAIEKSLDEQACGAERSEPSLSGRPTRIKRKVFYYAASVAAVFLLALVLIKHDSSYIHREGQIAILEEKPSDLREIPDEKTIVSEKSKPDGYIDDLEFPDSIKLVAEKGKVTKVEIEESGVKRAGAELKNEFADAKEKEAEESIVVEKEDIAGVYTESVAENRNGGTENTAETKEKYNVYAYDWESEQAREMADWNNGRKEYSLSLFSNVVSRNNISVSGQYLSIMTASGISHSNSDLQTMEIISEAKYSLPINIGLQAQVKVNRHFSVGLGLSYTWLRSKYDGLVNKKYYRIKQSLHYIGVPVNAYFTLLDKNNFYCYVNVGGAIEKGVKASYKLLSYDGTSRSTDAGIDGFQYSANAGFGLEYRFAEQFGLYLEPNIVYYFDSNIPASIRTDQPLQVKAEIGFRFHLK